MNHKIAVVFAALLMVSGAFICCSVIGEDASAANTGSSSNPLTSLTLYAQSSDIRGATFYVASGSYVNLVSQNDPHDGHSHFYYFVTPMGFPESGTVSKTGSYDIEIWDAVSYYDDEMEGYDYWPETRWWMTVKVVQNNSTVTFNANGGSCSTPSSTVANGTTITLPSASKPYCNFSGWFTASSGGSRVGGAGDSYTVNGNVTLYAQFGVIPVTITTTQPEVYMVQGSSHSYTVGTSPSDATISVSGASWLTMSGKTIVGVPTSSVTPGVYHITVTATYGSQTATQYYDIHVSARLVFESTPTGGIIAIAA